MLNPLTTREFSAQKLEDTPESGPADASGESSERWLILSVSAACSTCAGLQRSLAAGAMSGLTRA